MSQDDWALVVGIGTYGSALLRPLPGAVNDARAIHAWLVSKHGGDVPPHQAVLVLSPDRQPADEHYPTAEKVERFLRELYRRASESAGAGHGFRAGRRLWLFYAGHGLGFPDEKNAGPGLLAADAAPPDDVPHVAAYAWAEIFQVSRSFDEVVLFMDCCRTEAARTPPRRPAVHVRDTDPHGKLMAAYAVAHGRASYEEDVDGVPRGRFTRVVEDLLKHPPERPIAARRFLEHLERRFNDVDTRPPPNLRDDFELIGTAVARSDLLPPSLLVAHGETTAGLARHLASSMRSGDRFARAIRVADIESLPDSAFETVRELVIARDMEPGEVCRLMDHVKPARTVVFASRDPGVPGATFVARDGHGEPDLDDAIEELERALGKLGGRLVVRASEVPARVRIWDGRGRAVATGYGSVEVQHPLTGTYLGRASLGPYHSERSFEVVEGRDCELVLPPLDVPPTSHLDTAPLELDAGKHAPIARALKPGRRVLEVRFPDRTLPVLISVPLVSGWFTEVLGDPLSGAAGLRVRMVPEDDVTVGGRPTDDHLRDALCLALAAPNWPSPTIAVAEVADDPIAALFAAALALRSGSPHETFVDAAARILGENDPDVLLLRGRAELDVPPMLSFTWHHRVRRGELSVKEDSVADGIVGRLRLADPWLAWSSNDKTTSSQAWLDRVATVLWPGWNVEPDPELAVADMQATLPALGAPADSVRRHTNKSPPVDSLRQHHRVAFVGGSNDQLPAALAVAFVARGQRKWEYLEVWSLQDTLLQTITSAGQSGTVLLKRRDKAEAQLRQLLPHVAEQWFAGRYDGLYVDGQHCFASLWDWERPNGYVHVSLYRAGAEVRIAQAEDLRWIADEPPPRYGAVVAAYERTLHAGLK